MTKVVFLDRDGTINVDKGYVYEIEKFKFAQGAVEGMRKLADSGYALAVITNQSGIAAGYYTEEDMARLHQYMEEELIKQGVQLKAIAYCPHGREGGCGCRKPEIGMIKQVENKLGKLDLTQSWTIGDKEADLIFGKRAGTKTALVRSGYWRDDDLSEQPNMIVESLAEAAEKIIGR